MKKAPITSYRSYDIQYSISLKSLNTETWKTEKLFFYFAQDEKKNLITELESSFVTLDGARLVVTELLKFMT